MLCVSHNIIYYMRIYVCSREEPWEHTGFLECGCLHIVAPSPGLGRVAIEWQGGSWAGAVLFRGLSCFADILVAMALGNC